ncbi:MAG: C69 family dipeptidase [Bacteroidales bacterium]|nr:C69 family dipeptidase [Bacteroidales bacterium]
MEKGKNILKVLMLSAIFMTIGIEGNTCTNVIVSRGASKDGSVLVSYAADSHYLFGELYFRPAVDWAPGSILNIYDWDSHRYLGDIEQVEHTFQTVGNMNEYQVIITETTWGGRPELEDKKGGIDYGSLIYITLQRAKSAREAIDIIVDLANTYGYASEGETFSIADKNEAWIMELIGKGMNIRNGVNVNKGIVWVARRVPDGAICAHANQARIGTFPLNDPDNCLYAPDVIRFARRKGYYDGPDSEFSFKKAYCPIDFGTVRGCDARAWSAFNILTDGWFSFYDDAGNAVTKDAYGYLDYVLGNNLEGDIPLFVFPRKKVGVKELADVMRDHFEGTPMDMTQDIGAGGNALPYRWRPMEWEFDGKTYVNERAIATQQTGFWMVGQARNYVPDVVGGILWFGTDDAATSYLSPIYTSVTKIPECFREGNGDLLHYSPTASFWINNRISNACYKMYNIMAPYVRAKADAFEIDQMEHRTHSVDSMAVVMYNQVVIQLQKKLSSKRDVMVSSKPYAKIVKYVTDYSVNTAQEQFKAWQKLEEELLIKFMDGNVKPQNPDGSFKHSEFSTAIPEKIEWPGYTELWKETVAQEHGEIIVVPE